MFNYSFSDTLIEMANKLLGIIGIILEGGVGSAEYGIDYMLFAQIFAPIFSAFAYSFCLLFIGINIMESAVQYELFTLKGALKVGARLLLAKIWIDISVTVCEYIINIGTAMTGEIINLVDKDLEAFPSVNITSSIPGSDIPIIGSIIDTMMMYIVILPVIIMVLFVIVISFCVIIKVVMRTFELTMLITVSPIFFACWVGDTTKQYFRKFILTFMGVVFQLVFMALIYAITTSWIHQQANVDSGTDILTWFSSAIPWFITLIAMGIMMVKPPKILTSLIS